MAHAKLHRQQMLDWIERSIDQGAPMPDDAAICHAFGFTSAEHARTLLAELADAGKITVKGGYGPDRQILLGRVRAGVAAMARPVPSITKAAADVGEAVAKIIAIANRQKTLQVASPAAVAKVEAMTKPQTKSVTIVVSGGVLEELKRRTEDGTPYNRATLDLLEQAMAVPQAQGARVGPPVEEIGTPELLGELARRLAEERPNPALAEAEEQLRTTAERVLALEQRAIAAEEALAKVRSAVGL
ncbi:hypothetical protein [Sphingomonas zeae]